MVKAVGSLCVFTGFALMGIKASMRLSEHVNTLYGLIAALDTIESEIRCRLAPIPAVLRLALQTAQDAAGKCRSFLRCCLEELERRGPQELHGIWCRSVESELGILPGTERACLKELSSTLGSYDADEQAAAIGSVRRRLEVFLRAAELERERSGRVYATLGITVGIAVVIVMI